MRLFSSGPVTVKPPVAALIFFLRSYATLFLFLCSGPAFWPHTFVLEVRETCFLCVIIIALLRLSQLSATPTFHCLLHGAGRGRRLVCVFRTEILGRLPQFFPRTVLALSF